MKDRPPLVKRTNPDKLLWPEDGITKTDLIDYLEAVSEPLLEELRGRALTVIRAPDGIEGFRFFQKQAPDHTPDWIDTVTLPAPASRRKEVRYLVCNRGETLEWLGNQAALELHPSLAPAGRPAHPDAMVFDLDPPEGGFAQAVEAAKLFRRILKKRRLRSIVKTTGGKGLHVFVPLDGSATYEQTHAAAEAIGREAIETGELAMTFAMRKRERGGKLLIDIGRNGPGATTVSVFSPRARPGAPVSFPVSWSDVDRVAPQDFTIRTVPGLLGTPAVRNWRRERRRGQPPPQVNGGSPSASVSVRP